MSLHQISESERQRAATTRARLARLGIERVVVPKPVFTKAPTVMDAALFDWNCRQYFNSCFEGACSTSLGAFTPLRKRITLEAVMQAVALKFRVSVTGLLSHRRGHGITVPRHIAMWLGRELTLRSLPEIGNFMGKRDHSTICYGVHKIERLRHEDPELQAKLDHLISVLRPVSPESGNADPGTAVS